MAASGCGAAAAAAAHVSAALQAGCRCSWVQQQAHHPGGMHLHGVVHLPTGRRGVHARGVAVAMRQAPAAAAAVDGRPPRRGCRLQCAAGSPGACERAAAHAVVTQQRAPAAGSTRECRGAWAGPASSLTLFDRSAALQAPSATAARRPGKVTGAESASRVGRSRPRCSCALPWMLLRFMKRGKA